MDFKIEFVVSKKQQEIINQFKINNESTFEKFKYKIKIDVIIDALLYSINSNDINFEITEGNFSRPTDLKLKELYNSLKSAK